MHFADIGRVPGDPILGLMDAYQQDTNPDKFDLAHEDIMGMVEKGMTLGLHAPKFAPKPKAA